GAEREERRGRIAAGIREQPSLRREELRQSVLPLAEPVGPRMLEAVPALVPSGVVKAMRAREVDDDAAPRRLQQRGALVVEADEEDVGAAGERRLVGDEVRQPAAAVPAQAWIERCGRLPGER